MQLTLTNNNGYKWFKGSGYYARGFAQFEDHFFENESWDEFFINIDTQEDYTEKIARLNGFFSLVFIKDDKYLLAVDRVRTMPLFYSMEDNWISDHPESVLKKEKIDFDDFAVKEFFSTGYVTGTTTLLKKVKQVQAGEVTVISAGTATNLKYFKYLHTTPPEYSDQEFYDACKAAVIKTFSRLKQYSKKGTLVIPLSAGYDSRFIIYGCKFLDIKNVICFTYGRKNDYDPLNALNIAEELGYPIHFVDFSNGLKEFYQSSIIDDYDKFAFNYVSIPHLQDLQAVHYLLGKGLIPQNSIVVPGHSGDFISGRHLEKIFSESDTLPREVIADEILRRQYCIFDPSPADRAMFRDHIINLFPGDKSLDCGTVYEHWEWQERHPKFLVNSIKVYEFMGLKWYLPLWDNELVDFFLALPKKKRIDQRFYVDFVLSLYPVIETTPVKKSKLGWLSSVLLKRYSLKDWLVMLWISFKFGDFRIQNRRTIHKLNLTRFKFLLEK